MKLHKRKITTNKTQFKVHWHTAKITEFNFQNGLSNISALKNSAKVGRTQQFAMKLSKRKIRTNKTQFKVHWHPAKITESNSYNQLSKISVMTYEYWVLLHPSNSAAQQWYQSLTFTWHLLVLVILIIWDLTDAGIASGNSVYTTQFSWAEPWHGIAGERSLPRGKLRCRVEGQRPAKRTTTHSRSR